MSSLQQTEEAQKSLKEAKTTIEEVVLHDKTSSSPEAFLYKSLIYSALANDTTMQDAATDAIQISFDALNKAEELDSDSELKAERSEEHTSELQSLMRISYAVFCLKKTIDKSSNTKK